MKTGIIIQARMGSTRLPGKVMKKFHSDRPMLGAILARLEAIQQYDDDPAAIVATSTSKNDDCIAEYTSDCGYKCFRGSEIDVLARFYDAARAFDLDNIVRITADCPLVDPGEVKRAIDLFGEGDCDYLSNAHRERQVPSGFDIEVFTMDALRYAHYGARLDNEREHVTPFMFQDYQLNPLRLVALKPAAVSWAKPFPHLSVDTPEDFERVQIVFSTCVGESGLGFKMEDVLYPRTVRGKKEEERYERD